MDRYSFAGKGSVLIRAAANGTYGAKQFKINEPIAYFTEVDVALAFSTDERVGNTGINNLTSVSKSSPSVLYVNNIKVQDSLLSLLYKQQVNNTKHRTLIKSIRSENGIAYLPVVVGTILEETIFIYTPNKTRVVTFVFDNIDNAITGLDDGSYTIFFSISSVSKNTFFLDTPQMPKLSIEVHINGNIGGKDGDMVMHFDSASLITRPVLDFAGSATPFIENLEFVILNDKSPVEVNYYGN